MLFFAVTYFFIYTSSTNTPLNTVNNTQKRGRKVLIRVMKSVEKF